MSHPLNPKTIELELDSGIRIHITPLNRHHIAAAVDAANEKYPLPDEKAFEVVIDDGAIPGGVTVPANENPEYVQLVQEVQIKRHHFKLDAMIDMGVKFPDFPTRQDVINHFAPDLQVMSKYIDLPADEWRATWRYGVLRTDEDENVIINALMNQLPLTEAEIIGEMKLFFRLLPQPSADRLRNRKGTPSGVDS